MMTVVITVMYYFRFLHDSQGLTQKLQDILQEMKLKQLTITEYKKKMSEAESKLQVQQNLFETVRRDRNTFSKMLLESQVSVLRSHIRITYKNPC